MHAPLVQMTPANMRNWAENARFEGGNVFSENQ
jgi:hypothetical protein